MELSVGLELVQVMACILQAVVHMALAAAVAAEVANHIRASSSAALEVQESLPLLALLYSQMGGSPHCSLRYYSSSLTTEKSVQSPQMMWKLDSKHSCFLPTSKMMQG